MLLIIVYVTSHKMQHHRYYHYQYFQACERAIISHVLQASGQQSRS